MQLLYKDEQVELKRDESVFNIIFNKVNRLTENKDVIFSHLIVDGVNVYENHEDYINKRISEISEIEIVARSMKEMIWETMVSIHEYLQRAVPALKELVNNSYEKFDEEAWQGIDQLTEGMQWMHQFKLVTNAANEQPANWEKIEEEFKSCEEHFKQLLEAVEIQDTILISDILAFEITPGYELLLESIEKALQDKEFLNRIN